MTLGRDELYFQCMNRARTAILRAPLPLGPRDADAIIVTLRRHTGAPAHVAESAFNEALSKLQLEIDETRHHPNRLGENMGDDGIQIMETIDGRIVILCPRDIVLRKTGWGPEIICSSIERAEQLSEAIRFHIDAKESG